jgi:pilus assembly protein Flp/PilA
MMAQYLRLRNAVSGLAKREEGAAMAEYGLLIALIAVVAIVAVRVLGAQISTVFTNITAGLGGA